VRYFLQRLGQLLIVFLLVTFAVMVIMRLGAEDPTQLGFKLLGGTPTEAEVAQAVKDYHLDRNWFVQYWYWITDLLFRFDLGYSKTNNLSVGTLIKPRMMTTALLGIYANVLGLLIAIPVAIRQAHKRDGAFDQAASVATFVGVGVPAIVLGILMQLLFVVRLDWFPSIGDKIYPWDDLGGHFENFFVPTLTLALPVAAIYARLLRGDMAATLQSDFITLASAKGMSTKRVLWRHALRNSLFSLVTSIGTNLGALVGSAIVVETLFDLDGLGTLLVTSTLSRDLFTVQGLIAIIVLLVVIVNLLVDLAYAVIDPRIRQMRSLG
jgi:peptide/nickel transport system permease protein